MAKYNSRIFLNPETSIGDSTMRCFDGKYIDVDGKEQETTYVTISDCYSKIKIHPIIGEDKNNFIKKIKLMRDELDIFYLYLLQKDDIDALNNELGTNYSSIYTINFLILLITRKLSEDLIRRLLKYESFSEHFWNEGVSYQSLSDEFKEEFKNRLQ